MSVSAVTFVSRNATASCARTAWAKSEMPTNLGRLGTAMSIEPTPADFEMTNGGRAIANAGSIPIVPSGGKGTCPPKCVIDYGFLSP